MVSQNQVRLTRQVPVITLIAVGAALAVQLLPGLHPFLIYNRTAVLNGELWRLVTGQWVHFTARHFLYDAMVFGVAGWMIECSGCPNYAWLCGLAPLAIGVGVLALEPQLEICGGLSGMATAVVVFLTLWGLEKPGAWRWICLLVLVVTIAKILFEMLTGHFVFLELEDHSIVLAPTSHVVGALAALAIYAWSKVQQRLSTR